MAKKSGTARNRPGLTAGHPSKAGNGLGITASSTTERKQAEEELTRYRYHLQELVAERTAELSRANERLRQEIADHRRAQQELRIRDSAMASSINAIAIADREGNLTYANNSFLRLWGFDDEKQILGRSAAEFWRMREKGVEVLETLRERYSWMGELVAVREDGSIFDVHVSASAVEDDHGKPICFMASFIDITERKRWEEALRDSEERFRLLFERVPIGYQSLDEHGYLMEVNPAWLDMLGYSRKEVIGRWFGDFLALQYVDRFKENFARFKAAGEIHGAELGIVRKDGSHMLASFDGKIAYDEQGAFKQTHCIVHDITERKKWEEKLQELYEQERTLRRNLEVEMKKRVEFTRALAHELKTPLTPVVMSSQALASQLKEEPLASLSRNVSRGASNLNSRIDELLDLARGEIGMLQLRARSLDMRQLLEEVIDDVATLASSREQSLVADLPPSLPLVQADEVRSRQIVLNLLNNAMKFTPEGGKITLRAREEDASLTVEVQDTGPGIAKKDQQRVFDPYHRRGSDAERHSGLGLGLALCKTLVDLHGGQIWVKSRPGKGSTFGFSLPLGVAGEQAKCLETK